jgi:hypothetical protein
MPTRFVLPCQTNALLTTMQATALPATRDMTSRTDHASSPHSTMPSPPIPDVEPGIGTTKCVLLAPTDGSSMPTRSVLPFLISALPMTMLETA